MHQKVGLRTFHFQDSSRPNWSGSGPRPVLTDVWYPATDSTQEQSVPIGPASAPLFTAGLAARDADPAPGKHPLVLLSHGSGGSALQLGWLGSGLARRGFIAAGVNHHGNNALEPYTPEGFLLWWERARDLSAAIDFVMETPDIGDLVDPDRIAAAGFSLGGYTVIALAGGIVDLTALRRLYRNNARDLLREVSQEVPDRPRLEALIEELLESDQSHRQSYLDSRVKCIFAIAPALAVAFTAEGLASVRVPVKIVVGDGDTVTPPESSAQRYAELIDGAELAILDGHVAHYTFLGEATKLGRESHPELGLDPPGVDRKLVHEQVAEMVSDYFSGILRGQPTQ